MKKLLIIILTAALVLPVFGNISSAQETFDGIATTWLFLEGQADGPVVTKIIAELSKKISSVKAAGLTLETAEIKHAVDGVYLCDENGDPADGPSSYIAFEVGETITSGGTGGFNPFLGSVFSRNDLSISIWADPYQVKLDAEEFTVDGESWQLHIDENCINNRICPDTALFNYRSSFSGTYMNYYTGKEEEVSLCIAAYEPESLAGGEKNPLIIWLHGQGEAGVDPDIAILGNEVSALAKETIQSHFNTGEVTGAYVLVPQCETYWMDEGDGTNGGGSGISRYTEILKDTIDFYLQKNTDIDTDRIYIGGCSNGGYMTMNMLITYPDIFAAAYPLCEAYSYYLFERDENGDYLIYGDEETADTADDAESAEGESADAESAEGESEDGESGESAESEGGESEEAEDTSAQMSEGISLVENEAAETVITRANGNNIISPDHLWMTEEKIESIKNIPIWFVSSADDPLVNIALYPLPTCVALLQAGNENCYISLLSGYGHGVWTAFFQDKVTGVQDNEALTATAVPAAADASPYAYPVSPVADTGGTFDAGGFTNIFEWMNAQSK